MRSESVWFQDRRPGYGSEFPRVWACDSGTTDAIVYVAGRRKPVRSKDLKPDERLARYLTLLRGTMKELSACEMLAELAYAGWFIGCENCPVSTLREFMVWTCVKAHIREVTSEKDTLTNRVEHVRVFYSE